MPEGLRAYFDSHPLVMVIVLFVLGFGGVSAVLSYWKYLAAADERKKRDQGSTIDRGGRER